MSDSASSFSCPVCGAPLAREGRTLRCPSGHCYDLAKSGYVNLLMSQQGGLHGDDRPMVRARTAFLSAGHYAPLLDRICDLALPYLPKAPNLFDAGCGEGWYTQTLHERLESLGYAPKSVGVDISRDALTAAAKRSFPAEFAVASLYHIPLKDSWASMILNVFAPDCMDEYSRILTDGGILVKVIPCEDHLLELKRAVYDSVYENEVSIPSHPDFELLADRRLRWTLSLPDHDTVCNLFAMTPYGRKTSPDDLAKLDAVDALSTTVSFSVLLYRKRLLPS